MQDLPAVQALRQHLGSGAELYRSTAAGSVSIPALTAAAWQTQHPDQPLPDCLKSTHAADQRAPPPPPQQPSQQPEAAGVEGAAPGAAPPLPAQLERSSSSAVPSPTQRSPASHTSSAGRARRSAALTAPTRWEELKVRERPSSAAAMHTSAPGSPAQPALGSSPLSPPGRPQPRPADLATPTQRPPAAPASLSAGRGSPAGGRKRGLSDLMASFGGEPQQAPLPGPLPLQQLRRPPLPPMQRAQSLPATAGGAAHARGRGQELERARSGRESLAAVTLACLSIGEGVPAPSSSSDEEEAEGGEAEGMGDEQAAGEEEGDEEMEETEAAAAAAPRQLLPGERQREQANAQQLARRLAEEFPLEAGLEAGGAAAAFLQLQAAGGGLQWRMRYLRCPLASTMGAVAQAVAVGLAQQHFVPPGQVTVTLLLPGTDHAATLGGAPWRTAAAGGRPGNDATFWEPSPAVTLRALVEGAASAAAELPLVYDAAMRPEPQAAPLQAQPASEAAADPAGVAEAAAALVAAVAAPPAGAAPAGGSSAGAGERPGPSAAPGWSSSSEGDVEGGRRGPGPSDSPISRVLMRAVQSVRVQKLLEDVQQQQEHRELVEAAKPGLDRPYRDDGPPLGVEFDEPPALPGVSGGQAGRKRTRPEEGFQGGGEAGAPPDSSHKP